MNEPENENAIEKVNSWMKNSLMLKLITITILILLLLIPTSMIKSIINERELLSEEARREVSSKWANSQQLTGPILTVPLYFEEEEIVDDKRVFNSWTENLRILPRDLKINGEINPESLKRGIYEVVVYKSDLKIEGHFDVSKLAINKKDLKEIRWNESQISFGISDLRGISNRLKLKVNQEEVKIKPGSPASYVIKSGISGRTNLTSLVEKPIKFSLDLDLQGSESLSFVPLGTTTEVNLTSPWSAPSFKGQFIPKSRTVNENGFAANWMVLELNRTYPESWIGDLFASGMMQSSFGTDLILPLDDYQKSMRSSKYAVMTIGLTFLIFFIMEIMNKRKVHPFQYTLVGLSLSTFYVLLVSLSEHVSFNLAYGISMVAIVCMISAYSLTVFRKRQQSVVLTSVMIGFYGFMFVTLQLTDYALLLGSIGLVIIIGLTMYFTRNINWYGLKFSTHEEQ